MSGPSSHPSPTFRMDAGATFDSLTPRRVHDILVVASPYDAFVIEEGGRLTELILNEYVSLNLSDAPSVTRAATAEDALLHLAHKRFDLVFTMVRAGGMDGFTFARKAKELDPNTPVVMLAYDTSEMQRLLAHTPRDGIDYMFTWHGDARLFLAVIKLIEDQWNVDHDTSVAQVRTILLIEDSVRFASIYLPLLYTELVDQTQSLLDEGLNLTQRLLRIRARPKVLWAQDFEGAIYQYEKYRPYILGVITDLSFPRGGEVDPQAGLELVHRIKSDDSTMPIVLQSSMDSGQKLAERHDVHFIQKRSPKLLKKLQNFLASHFGFGDFVFFLPDGSEWARAKDLKQLAERIAEAPDECLRHHSRRNDFSNWMRARTEFELASKIRPRKVEEFGSIDALRHYLVHTLHIHRAQAQRGIVADFSPSRFDEASEFVRIGRGSLGGKGRGLAFANALLLHQRVDDSFQEVNIRVPPTAVIGTDVFDAFLKENDLHDTAYGDDEGRVLDAFVQSPLPKEIEEYLRSFLARVEYPLAVRSSSLLEDSQSQPFAGIYKTYMIPNNHPDFEVRLKQLARAVKLVYASTFSRESKSYIESTPYRIEDEKMAVILQQLVGHRHGDRFYPTVSGVARSYNFYPVAPMRPEEGIAVMALGFGQQVVGGSDALRFSPVHPRNIPQFGTVKDTLHYSQKQFVALDLSEAEREADADHASGLLRLELDDALADGSLTHIASAYSADDDRLYDGLGRGGDPVITFAPLLKTETYPLCGILRRLLEIGATGMGGPVEMEFAVDLSAHPARFGFLQIRRLVIGEESDEVAFDDEAASQAVCFSGQALGNGMRDDIVDLVYVRPDAFQPGRSPDVADQVGKINQRLTDQHRPYVLIGPGRWGSSDPWLGVPARWDQISGARLIIETALEDFRVTPSQGTHFFQNMTARRIGYFTVNPFVGEDRLDWEWLDQQDAEEETEFVRHLRMHDAFRIRIDGRTGRGAIFPPPA